LFPISLAATHQYGTVHSTPLKSVSSKFLPMAEKAESDTPPAGIDLPGLRYLSLGK
jgi:hypothetical protein